MKQIQLYNDGRRCSGHCLFQIRIQNYFTPVVSMLVSVMLVIKI